MDSNPQPLNEEERSTYEWQMWSDGFGESGQEKLKGASVLISRIGGVGGAVAYYLLAGRPIFEAATELDLLYKVVNEAPKRPSKFTDQPIPGALEKLIMDCLAKDPAERPPSIFAVLERLEGCASADPWTQADAIEWWSAAAVAEESRPAL